jgi:hypothetical protein
VNDSEIHKLSCKGHAVEQKTFFSIFLTFELKSTLLWVTLVQNVKKGKNSTHPSEQYAHRNLIFAYTKLDD